MSQRYEREIDEILRKLDGQLAARPRNVTPLRRSRSWRRGTRGALWALYSLRWRWGADYVMLTALALGLLSFALRPLFGFLVGPVALLSLGFFVVGYGIGLRRHRARPERRWRGQPLSDPRDQWNDIWRHLRTWWRRR